MDIEKLTGEIEDWLEKADEEENLKFMVHKQSDVPPGAIVIEMLGYYGSIGQIVTKELQKISVNTKKIAGVFSNYFNEMVQISSGEILLPISLLYTSLKNQSYIFTSTNFAIPDIISYQLAENLYQLYQDLNVSKIILIDGVFSNKRNLDELPQVYKIEASSVININTAPKENFTLTGQVASSFLTYWAQPNRIPIDVVAIESLPDFDPISSLEVLKYLSKEYFGFSLSFADLKKQIEEFKKSELKSDLNSDTQVNEDMGTKYFV